MWMGNLVINYPQSVFILYFISNELIVFFSISQRKSYSYLLNLNTITYVLVFLMIAFSDNQPCADWYVFTKCDIESYTHLISKDK